MREKRERERERERAKRERESKRERERERENRFDSNVCARSMCRRSNTYNLVCSVSVCLYACLSDDAK